MSPTQGTKEWRRPHNDEICVLHVSPNINRVIKSRRMRCAGHVASMGKRRGAYRTLVGKRQRRRTLGILRSKWEGHIKMVL